MAMTERAFTYADVQSYELRKMRVLDGTLAQERANTRRMEMVKLGLAVLALLVYLLGITFIEAKITVTGTEINELQAAIENTRNESAKADLVIGSLSSLDRIEKYALNNLGMVYPDARDIYYLDEESSLAIAQGWENLSGVAVAEAEKRYPLWQSIGDTLSSWWHGTALAAEN